MLRVVGKSQQGRSRGAKVLWRGIRGPVVLDDAINGTKTAENAKTFYK